MSDPHAPLRDPRTLYHGLPFPRQPQPKPGLATEMTPVPDHGEVNYRGSGSLRDRRALITGGDLGIGRAASIAFGDRIRGEIAHVSVLEVTLADDRDGTGEGRDGER